MDSNSEVDALLDEAHSTKDEARKIEALGEALTIIQDECPALPILVQESTIGASKGLVCPEGSMNAQHYRFDLWYWAE